MKKAVYILFFFSCYSLSAQFEAVERIDLERVLVMSIDKIKLSGDGLSLVHFQQDSTGYYDIKVLKSVDGVWDEIKEFSHTDTTSSWTFDISKSGKTIAFTPVHHIYNRHSSIEVFDLVDDEWINATSIVEDDNPYINQELSLSKNGNQLAIRSYGGITIDSKDTLKVFERNNSALWGLKGNPIFDSVFFRRFANTYKINGQGDRVFIGAPTNYPDVESAILIYDYNVSTNLWDLNHSIKNIEDDVIFGNYIATNTEGNIMSYLTLSPTKACVSICRENSNGWTIEEDIFCVDFFEWSESLNTTHELNISDDGEIISFGLEGNIVKAIRKVDSDWVEIGGILEPQVGTIYGNSVSMSDDGNVLAVLYQSTESAMDYHIMIYQLDPILNTFSIFDSADPLIIYPNPATSSIQIKGSSTENFNFAIYNQLGQVVQDGVFSNNSTIDISSLEAGKYFLLNLENYRLGHFIKL